MTRVVWDTELGRQLYDDGNSFAAIAECCKTSAPAVAHQAYRYWGPRRGEAQKHWNRVIGRRLWDEGNTYAVIAKRCKTTRSAVSGYARRHWIVRPDDPKPAADVPDVPKVMKAKPLPPGARTLPDLPSLVGYY